MKSAGTEFSRSTRPEYPRRTVCEGDWIRLSHDVQAPEEAGAIHLELYLQSAPQATVQIVLAHEIGKAAIATIDLNKRCLDPWLGDMRGRTIKEYRGDVPILRSDSVK